MLLRRVISWLSVLVLCLDTSVLLTSCGRVKHETALRKKLGIFSANSDFKLTPAGQPVIVNISLTFLQIQSIDEKDALFSSSVWLRLTWRDSSKVWNASEYGSVNELRVNADRVWVPDIFLLNNAKGSFEVQGANAKIVIRSDGVVIWANPALYKSSCDLDMKYFPFDDQKCSLKFGSLTYNISSCDIYPERKTVDTFRYVESGEWILLGTSAKRSLRKFNGDTLSYVTYSVEIRRRTLYYIMNFILPCVLIAVLTVLVFLLPPESGERVSYGITVILSFTILLLMLYEKLPVTSDAYPLIAVYYACTTFQVSIALAFCCWVLRFYHHDPPTDALPRWVKVVVLNWLARVVRLKKSTDQVRQELILHSWEELAHSRQKISHKSLSVVMNNIFKKEEESAKREEWRIASTILNRLFLWFFIATGIFTFIIVFLDSPRARALNL